MSHLPEHHILDLGRHQVWPRGAHLHPKFLEAGGPKILRRSTPVASMGSCFASVVKTHLLAKGYQYVQTSQHRAARSTSAAWGTVFNTFTMKQELLRVVEGLHPTERWWSTGGRLLDPYRKGVEWANQQEAEQELAQHAQEAWAALEQAQVLVLTLGLTEVWYSRQDGLVFYQVPPQDVYDPQLHAFRASGVQENLDNLCAVLAMLRSFNPGVQLVVTVSPVPLRATFRDTNVLVANARSKSTLLVAAHQFCEAHQGVHYFPSYELVTTTVPEPYKPDNRHVTDFTGRAVMDTFLATFG